MGRRRLEAHRQLLIVERERAKGRLLGFRALAEWPWLVAAFADSLLEG
jgi:hypothetical protein